MENTKHPLLTEIDKFLKSSGMSAYTFGFKSSKDGRLVERLRAGSDIGTRKAERIKRWIAENSNEVSA